ncbi:hypothetical protein LTR93_011378 [Exophiala xenobiotica]|nr:hypothetical protein LTR93_011378 [Exophiala xenobiotica]
MYIPDQVFQLVYIATLVSRKNDQLATLFRSSGVAIHEVDVVDQPLNVNQATTDDSGCEVSPLNIRRGNTLTQNGTLGDAERLRTPEGDAETAQTIQDVARTDIDPLKAGKERHSQGVLTGDVYESQAEDHVEDNSSLSSPWGSDDDLAPRDPPSWVHRAAQSAAEQSPEQGHRVFGAVPPVSWPQPQPLSHVTPPPGPTPPSAQSSPTLSDPSGSSIASSPPLPNLTNMLEPHSDSTIDERTPSPLFTPTPLAPPTRRTDHDTRLLAKHPRRRRNPDRSYKPTVSRGTKGPVVNPASQRSHATKPQGISKVYNPSSSQEKHETFARRFLKQAPRRPARGGPQPKMKQTQLIDRVHEQRTVQQQIAESYRPYPYIPIELINPKATAQRQHFHPYLITAVASAVLDGEGNHAQKPILHVLKECMDDWYRIPYDLDDRRLATEISQIRKDLKPWYGPVSETRDALTIIRTISENVKNTGQLNSMVEILQYGMLEVACHLVDHNPEKARLSRFLPIAYVTSVQSPPQHALPPSPAFIFLPHTDGFRDGLTNAKTWFAARSRGFLFFFLVDYLRRRGVAPLSQDADSLISMQSRSALEYVGEAFAGVPNAEYGLNLDVIQHLH